MSFGTLLLFRGVGGIFDDAGILIIGDVDVAIPVAHPGMRTGVTTSTSSIYGRWGHRPSSSVDVTNVHIVSVDVDREAYTGRHPSFCLHLWREFISFAF